MLQEFLRAGINLLRPQGTVCRVRPRKTGSKSKRRSRVRDRHGKVVVTVALYICCVGSIQCESQSGPASQSAVNGGNVATELQRAAALIQAGHTDEAEQALRRLLAANATNADAHNLLGVAMDQRGNPVEAEREYRTALSFSPRSISARANLGCC